MNQKEHSFKPDKSSLLRAEQTDERDSLSGYAARPRTDWQKEATAVVSATAVFLGAAYASWEHASTLLSRMLVSETSASGASLWQRMVRHPAFRLVVLSPVVSLTSSALAGAVYGFLLGDQADTLLGQEELSPTIRQSVAVGSGTFIAVTTLDSWQKVLSDHIHHSSSIPVRWGRPVALAAAASSGMASGLGISSLFTENVMLFRRTRGIFSRLHRHGAEKTNETQDKPLNPTGRTEPSAGQ
jgi:hypothetical protein